MRHLTALLVTMVCGAVAWFGWTGVEIAAIGKWDGLPNLLRGTWVWDLRYALIPAYAVTVLWICERAGAVLAPK
jgi:xanthine/uracil permease